MRIRLATDADLPAITEIYNEAILNSVATFDTEVKSLDDRRAWFKKYGGPHPVYVAELGEPNPIGETEFHIVGWASLTPYSDRSAYAATVENSVYVSPNYRGRRIGVALMQALVDHARAHQLHVILARISDGNEASIKLHRQFGFELVGIMREVGVKFGRCLDVHLMQVIFRP